MEVESYFQIYPFISIAVESLKKLLAYVLDSTTTMKTSAAKKSLFLFEINLKKVFLFVYVWASRRVIDRYGE